MKFKAVNKNKEFIKAYRKGKCSVQPGVVVYCIKNRYHGTRIGITSSKKIGCAVKRSLNLDMSKGYDLIFVARGKTARLKSYQVADMINLRLRETGYLDA